jgi:hypothetical protein
MIHVKTSHGPTDAIVRRTCPLDSDYRIEGPEGHQVGSCRGGSPRQCLKSQKVIVVEIIPCWEAFKEQ